MDMKASGRAIVATMIAACSLVGRWVKTNPPSTPNLVDSIESLFDNNEQ
jgi:hypothetical protein